MEKSEKCSICETIIEKKFLPMKEWSIEGVLCGDCYSKKISEHYPGDHARVNVDK